MFKEIWGAARRNKLRTALTGFPVAWGIFMIIFLLGSGNGLINAQLQQQNNYLTNSMLVGGGYTSKPYHGLKENRAITLDDRDVEMTDTLFAHNVKRVGGVAYAYGVTVRYANNYVADQTLVGEQPSGKEINKRKIICGRYINDIDIREKRKVVVLTDKQAAELVKDYHDIIGKHVEIGGLAFVVVGIIKDDQQMQNKQLFTAFSTLKAIYAKGNKTDEISIELKNISTLKESEDMEERYRQKINMLHDAAPDDTRAIWVWNRFSDNAQMEQGISILRTALWVIGLFTLISGIVGVSNIMLISVKERTKEFGIRKAIGAKPWDILKLIIVESMITTAIFGYIGMICGVAANEYMNATIGQKTVDTGLFQATMFVNPTVGLDICIQATLVIIIAGTVAGLMPAIKAARVRPIEALRAE